MSETLITIPVFNGEDHILTSLQSCLNQSIKTDVLVVDNCSTDSTVKIVYSLMQKNPQIKLVKNDQNVGRIRNLSRCFELFVCSQYNYLKILFCGDELPEKSIETSEKILKSNSDVAILNGAYIFDNGIDQKITAGSFYNNKRVCLQDLINDNYYPSHATGTLNSVVYTKKGISNIRPNPLFLGIAMFHNDILAENGDIYYTPEILGKFNLKSHSSFSRQFQYKYFYESSFCAMHALEKSSHLFDSKKLREKEIDIAANLIVNIIKLGRAQLLYSVASSILMFFFNKLFCFFRKVVKFNARKK